MSLKAKDAPERIYIDMERMHDFSDASRAIVSTEHATNPTENDVLYVRAAFMEEVREVLEGFCPPKLAEIESLLWDGIDDSAHGTMTVTCGQMRRARALFAKMEGK